MPLASLRGATTTAADEPQAILDRTCELVLALLSANPALTPASALAVFLTVTPDLTTAFPAAALRALGFTETPLLGGVEMAVTGAPARCIRLLALFAVDESGQPQSAFRGRPVYLHGARVLRPDLGGGPR